MLTPPPARSAVLLLALLVATACDEVATGEVGTLPALQRLAAVSSPAAGGAVQPDDPVAAATAVVRRYYAALNGLRRRMAAAPLARLVTVDCSCRAQIRAIRAAARRGERYTDRIRVLHLVGHLDRPDLVDVVVSLDVGHGGLVDAAGNRLAQPTTLRNLHREVLLRLVRGRWLIAEVLAV